MKAWCAANQRRGIEHLILANFNVFEFSAAILEKDLYIQKIMT